MKRNCIFTFLFTCVLAGVMTVNASSCSYAEQAELNSSVAGIKVAYEEKTGYHDSSTFFCQDDDPECVSEYNYFEISILNMTKDFYVTVSNDIDNIKTTYTYADAVDGVIKFNWEGIMNIATFTFEVYSSTETGCPRENYRVIYLTTPRKNPYHYYLQCQNNPDYYLCDKYVTFENIEYYDFITQVDEYVEENNEELKEKQQLSFMDKVLNFVEDNKVLLVGVGTGLLIVIIIIVTITKTKKRKRSAL